MTKKQKPPVPIKSPPSKKMSEKEHIEQAKANSKAIQEAAPKSVPKAKPPHSKKPRGPSETKATPPGALTASTATEYLAAGSKARDERASTPPRELTAEEKAELEAERDPHPRPKAVVVVAARDGKWVYGAEEDEAALRNTPKGKFSSAADASEAAGHDHDIVINTGPASAVKKSKQRWGQAPTEESEQTPTNPEGEVTMPAKKKAAATKPAAKPLITPAKSGGGIDAKKAATKPSAGTTTGKKPSANAAPSAATAKRPAGKFDETSKLSWLVKDNPRAKGSATHHRFAKYFGTKTVGDYLAKGGTLGDLRWDVAHKYLTVAK